MYCLLINNQSFQNLFIQNLTVGILLYTARTVDCETSTYHIRPNYRTVHLGISKLLGTLICGKICIYLPRIRYKKDQKRVYLMMIMRVFFCFFVVFF